MIISSQDPNSIHYQLIDLNTGLIIPYVTWADDKKKIYHQLVIENNKILTDKYGNPKKIIKSGNIKLQINPHNIKINQKGKVEFKNVRKKFFQ